MKVNVQALGTFNRLAHEGAEHAADSLGQLSAVSPTVEATSINLVGQEDIGDEFPDERYIGVQIDFDGGLAGRTVLVMDEPCARQLLESLPIAGDADTLEEDPITEVGNIILGGFLDGWADYLDAAIELSTPTYLEGKGSDVLPSDTPTWSEHEQVFAFASQLETGNEAVSAFIYMFPELWSFERLVETQLQADDLPIPFERLTVFNRMTKHGARKASEHMTDMSGIETAVEISQLTFTPIEHAPSQISDDRYIGVVFELTGQPSGFVVILFDKQSAYNLASALVPFEEEEFGRIHESAIQEVGNIMTSGFIDGWANVLETTIDMSPPQFVDDMGRAILDPIATRLGQTQDFAFLIDSTIDTVDHEVSCEIFALPNEHELTEALNEISMEPDDVPDIDSPFPGMEASYEDL